MAGIQADSILAHAIRTYAKARSAASTSNLTTTNVGLSLLLVLGVSLVVNYQRKIRAVSNLPGLRVAFFPIGIPGAVIPTTWWNPGYSFIWLWKDFNYKRFGNDTFSIVPFLLGHSSIFTANLDVAHQTIGGGHKTSFEKPELFHRALLLWGMNLVAADKEVWRKHRRIVGPAFNNSLYEMVWQETLKTYRDMSALEFGSAKSTDVPVIQKLTFKLALLIIGKCGFGFNFNWNDPPKSADGTMSLQEALRVVADTNMMAILLPNWAKKLPIKKIQESNEAHEQLLKFMQSQVSLRRQEIHTKSVDELEKDAFTMLVKANEDEGTKFKLDDGELIGNVFVMLFAGHETTAHTLAATLGFLSVHPDIQEDVYQQIFSVVGKDSEPGYQDYAKLDKVLAVFYEALRMFPAGHLMIREAWEDTVLQVPNPVGEEGSQNVPVAKGTLVITDMIGVHYNPRYFPDPNSFVPSRWHGKSTNPESETFTAFSIGPRACIGRKFATLESVCFLTSLLRDYEVKPLLKDGETKEEWRTRVLDATMAITLGVKDVPVTFVRRG